MEQGPSMTKKMGLIAAIIVAFACGCSRQSSGTAETNQKRAEPAGPPPSRTAFCQQWVLSTVDGNEPSAFGIISFELAFHEDGRWENRLKQKGQYKPVIDVTASGTWKLDGHTLRYEKAEEVLEATVSIKDGALVLDPDPVFAMPGGGVVGIYVNTGESQLPASHGPGTADAAPGQ